MIATIRQGIRQSLSLSLHVPLSPRTGALVHCVGLGAREAWSEKLAMAARFLTFSVIIGIWASLWHIVPAATLARVSLSYEQLVWYFTLTEIVVFSLGHCYRQIEEDIASGALATAFIRPVSYIALTLAEELGRMIVTLGGFTLPSVALAWALTGQLPLEPAMIVFLPVTLAGGGAIVLGVQMLVGLSAAWLGTARPVFFITQKLIFVLGGMIVPLTAYPDLLRKLAWATPFPAMLYAPASLILDPARGHAEAMLALQGIWLIAILLAVVLLSAAFERRVLTKGLI